MKKLLLIPLIATTLCSCNSTFTRTLSTPMYAPKAEINPIRADVEVDMNKKLSGEAQASYLFCFKVSKADTRYADGMNFSGDGVLNTLNKLKAAAAYKAVTASGTDIIVHPNYVIEKHNYIFFRTYNIKVSGYAGYFKKFYQEPYEKENKTHHAGNIICCDDNK